MKPFWQVKYKSYIPRKRKHDATTATTTSLSNPPWQGAVSKVNLLARTNLVMFSMTAIIFLASQSEHVKLGCPGFPADSEATFGDREHIWEHLQDSFSYLKPTYTRLRNAHGSFLLAPMERWVHSSKAVGVSKMCFCTKDRFNLTDDAGKVAEPYTWRAQNLTGWRSQKGHGPSEQCWNQSGFRLGLVVVLGRRVQMFSLRIANLHITFRSEISPWSRDMKKMTEALVDWVLVPLLCNKPLSCNSYHVLIVILHS